MTEGYKLAQDLYEQGEYAEALQNYLMLAETTGDPAVFAFIGKMYLRGQGTAPNEAEGRRWYTKAADCGDPRAMLYLAGLHSRRGEYKETLARLDAAATLGYGPALFFLGRMHGLGKGVSRDQGKARRYFELAAAKGHVWAQKEIALRMLRGQYGVSAIPKGVVSFLAAIANGVRIGRLDPDDERFRT